MIGPWLVLTLRKADALLSLTALVQGITIKIFKSLQTLDILDLIPGEMLDIRMRFDVKQSKLVAIPN